MILNFKSIGERASTRAGNAQRVGRRIQGRARRFAAARRALIDKVKAGA
jgi:hypothetical protein